MSKRNRHDDNDDEDWSFQDKDDTDDDDDDEAASDEFKMLAMPLVTPSTSHAASFGTFSPISPTPVATNMNNHHAFVSPTPTPTPPPLDSRSMPQTQVPPLKQVQPPPSLTRPLAPTITFTITYDNDFFEYIVPSRCTLEKSLLNLTRRSHFNKVYASATSDVERNMLQYVHILLHDFVTKKFHQQEQLGWTCFSPRDISGRVNGVYGLVYTDGSMKFAGMSFDCQKRVSNQNNVSFAVMLMNNDDKETFVSEEDVSAFTDLRLPILCFHEDHHDYCYKLIKMHLSELFLSCTHESGDNNPIGEDLWFFLIYKFVKPLRPFLLIPMPPTFSKALPTKVSFLFLLGARFLLGCLVLPVNARDHFSSTGYVLHPSRVDLSS